jgi:hypothetical protein
MNDALFGDFRICSLSASQTAPTSAIDKLAENDLAALKLVAIRIWLHGQ